MFPSLLGIAFHLPAAAPPDCQDVLYAVAGAATATGRSLDVVPADPGFFHVRILADAEHRACLLDTLERFQAAASANIETKRGVA